MATNENLIPVPGRLHSVASEGHVAGADEIYDDTLQKLQSEINGDVKVMGASGTNHSKGLVPDPGATQGTTKYLREDGTWQEVNAAPEVEIGETSPVGDVKLFVDEDADPAVTLDVYTRQETDTLLAAKADEATTISGYGITDAYTKTEVDSKIATAPEQSTINSTDFVVLKDADNVNRKISKANIMGVVKDALAELLLNNDLGTNFSNVPALSASAFGSATLANLASVLSAENVDFLKNADVNNLVYSRYTAYISGVVNGPESSGDGQYGILEVSPLIYTSATTVVAKQTWTRIDGTKQFYRCYSSPGNFTTWKQIG